MGRLPGQGGLSLVMESFFSTTSLFKERASQFRKVFLKQEWQVSRAGLASGSYSAATAPTLVTEEGLSKTPGVPGMNAFVLRSSFEP